MAQKANIVSFDEARRTSAARRGASARTSARLATSAFARAAKPAASASASVSARPAKSTAPVSARPARSAKPAPARASSRTSAPAARSSARRPSWYDGPAEDAAFASSSSHDNARGDGSIKVFTADDLRKEEEREGAPKKETRLRRLKRTVSKDKAERKFTKQYGASDSSAGEGAPRAALYKGEMGASHKRSSRIQNDQAAASGKSAARKKSFSLRALLSKPPMVATLGVAVCLALACAFLYPTAQQYYHSVREQDRLQAEYDAIAARNASIESEVQSLKTSEGIEDRAHEQYGWVMPGENAVNVYGLENIEHDNGFIANIVPGTVEAPETWYSRLLDPIFGVE